MTFNSKLSFRRPGWIRAAAIASLGVAALAATGGAQAGNVFWSLGVSAPGVQVGVANAPQVYVRPAPVYYQPEPVYVQPAPVYVQPAPVFYRPARVVVPAPVYYRPWAGYRSVAYVQPGFGYRHGPRHGQERGNEYGREHGRERGNGNGNGYAYGPVNGNGYTPSNNVGAGYGR